MTWVEEKLYLNKEKEDYNMSVHKATLRLFKALPIGVKKPLYIWDSPTVAKTTIPRGYIFSPEVLYHYQGVELRQVVRMIEANYGMTAESMNATFHKSWQIIADTPQAELFVQALAHYCTTYGKEEPLDYLAEKALEWDFDELGKQVMTLPDFDANKIFDEDYIYFPDELLSIPALEGESVKLVIIKGMTKEELKKRLLDLLATGIALGEDSIKDCITIAGYVGVEAHEAVVVKNKEVKIGLYDELEITPTDPIDFLRYVVYKATGETLLIKNEGLIAKIKASPEGLQKYFTRYMAMESIARLAEIFYRFKPIFLAMRKSAEMKHTINKVRRLAPNCHKPMQPDFLNNVTAQLDRGIMPGLGGIYMHQLREELEKANTFRKIRLAYALKYRITDAKSILYRIRNGKSYATEFNFERKVNVHLPLDTVLASIVNDLRPKVEGKRIFIPEYMKYTLPATEKMFTGNFPSGTSVIMHDDMIFGINWHNVPGKRIDLDLSIIDDEGHKVGWDARYASGDKNILFSGDITDAKGENGATELFYVAKPNAESAIMYVNYYNYDEEYPVPFKIVVAQSRNKKQWKENFVIDPNELVAQSNSKIEQKQKILGLAIINPGESRFVFAEAYMGNAITSRRNDYGDHARKYLFNMYRDPIDLREVLINAGAIINGEKGEAYKIDIDLSPEALEKDTIIRLLS